MPSLQPIRVADPAEQTRAAANRRKIQATEATVLALLLQRRAEIVARGKRLGQSPSIIAGALASAMYAAIVNSRRVSRTAGLTRLRTEASALGFTRELSPTGITSLAADTGRADFVSRSYANRWLKAALDAARAAKTAAEASQAPSIASSGTQGSIERIAATENAQAFNAEREAVARIGLSAFEWMKVWDAELDAKTCPICRSAEGTIVPVNDLFPLGIPGDVHPWCRCDWTLVHVELF